MGKKPGKLENSTETTSLWRARVVQGEAEVNPFDWWMNRVHDLYANGPGMNQCDLGVQRGVSTCRISRANLSQKRGSE